MNKTFLWSSSYGSKWHKLPKYLKKYVKKRKISVKAGRKLSKLLLDEIKEVAGKKQYHILILGMRFHPLFSHISKIQFTCP